ncbi:hypothetical protein BXY82_1970 [Gelidibacter sediminis]|uniref:Uncharacterized protein n=1 Tax=Gelidibacter sediminis TaxID=1608710 RepID=A0A4R7PZP6_9FLAO|nr:hypothetical protein [Gelidibacter sediminis]TDU39932.1 hypothetical protein BXY82_1970 [Gelidibacter sediminis]
MIAKLIKVTLFMLVLGVMPTYAQRKEAMEREREQYMEKQMDQYRDRVDTFVTLLKIDEFKGEIIKQKIDDFYQKRNQIVFSERHQQFEKDAFVEQLKTSHFLDVKELYTEETIASVLRFIEDNKAEIKKLQKSQTKKNN